MTRLAETRTAIEARVKAGYAAFLPVWPKLIGASSLLVGALVAVAMVEVSLIFLGGGFSGKPNFLMPFVLPLVFITHLLCIILGNGAQVVFIRICLKLVRQEKYSLIEEFKSTPKFLLPLFLSTILIAPAIVLGLFFAVFPGIYLALRFALFTVGIADGLNPIESIKKSFRITHGHMLEILGIFLLSQLALMVMAFIPFVNILGLIFFALPFMGYFWAHYYVQLESSPSKPAEAAVAFARRNLNATA